MAGGRPAAATAVGNVAARVAGANRPFIAASEQALAQALASLAADPALRAHMGQANRDKARATFDELAMIAAYRRLYSTVLGGDGLPQP